MVLNGRLGLLFWLLIIVDMDRRCHITLHNCLEFESLASRSFRLLASVG